jgi:hypothetical protein
MSATETVSEVETRRGETTEVVELPGVAVLVVKNARLCEDVDAVVAFAIEKAEIE